MHWISCLMFCKIIFCSEFLDIPDKAGEERRTKKEEEEHSQLQSVMHFTQTQLNGQINRRDCNSKHITNRIIEYKEN